MFKMQIQMDEEKILREDKINLMKVYAALDKIFAEHGLKKETSEADGTLNYVGYNDSTDFGQFGICTLRLEETIWFKPNCRKWLLIEKDETGRIEIDNMLTGETVHA